MTTFGFELEFSGGVLELIHELTERGYANQTGDRLHGYHCDCGYCADLHGIKFRAQRDSSCSGEIISGIFTDGDWPAAVDAMQALQDAALDTDAALSLTCGMHVHIGNTDGDEIAPYGQLSMGWLGIEPLLWEHVAGSVWAHRRGDQNTLLSKMVVETMQASRFWDRHDVYPTHERDLGLLSTSVQEAYVENFRALLDSMAWDRHCDLARASHGGIYEMRIFNATRVAWRIEMACRLSVALVDPEVAEHFATATNRYLFGQIEQLPNRMMALRNGYRLAGRQYRDAFERPLQQILPVTMEDFMATLSDFDPRLGELLSKQTGYATARRAAGPSIGTVSNVADRSRWNHEAVLAAMSPGGVNA